MNYNNKEALHTFTNPLALPNIPRGTDDWMKTAEKKFNYNDKPASVKSKDYRSISDPTVFYHDNKWYLYPSYGMAWVTEDFENWKHVRTEPYNLKYSPCITKWKNKFLMTSWLCGLYVSDDPLGPFGELGKFIMPDGEEFVLIDPCLFTEGDRLYLYGYINSPSKDNCMGFSCSIVGYELDYENPRRVIRGPVELIKMNSRVKPWERHGLHNQALTYGWCEGPHLLKHNGRYYLIYTAPDTCDASYCMAVYYSDESPLTGFKCQKRNPLTTHRHGIVTGAGHGCVEHGPNGTLWAFYTIATPYMHKYERRIGMDLVAVDENGELYCPFGVTDTPQYVPGYISDPLKGNSPEYCSLTGGIRPVASSWKEGREALYATDENNLSYWEPDDEDERPWIEFDLMGVFAVGSVRIFWRELALDYAKGVLPVPVKYVVERLCDGQWVVLVDKSRNEKDMNIDYQSFDRKLCRKLRLTIVNRAEIPRTGLIDFAAFGKMLDDKEYRKEK